MLCFRLAQPATSFKSKLLSQSILLGDNGGRFPDLSEELSYFDEAFDHKEAKAKGFFS